MDFFPFYNRPYYYPQNRYVNSPYSTMNRDKVYQSSKEKDRKKEDIKEQKEKQDVLHMQDKRNLDREESPVFEIFGIKLFFDDILIIALIFFLYNEGVRDNLLFIALILILLS